ncbi:MAG: universal stress protein [Anaerolineae bacterium]
MYDTILVPLDGSELAKAIIPHVKAMATGHEAEVILLRCSLPHEWSPMQQRSSGRMLRTI